MLISNNAYGILWLGIDSNEKNINKRYKEQLKFLEIEEIPEYDSDFSFIDYSKIRTSESIKESFHELSNQKKKLYQAFLWFQILDKSDEDALQKLIQWDIIGAIDLWSKLYHETNKLHYLKNAVIANLLWCEHREQFDDLDFSKDPEFIVDGLYECIYSPKFWKEFIDILNLTADTPISEEELEKFKHSLPQTLAEEFFDVAEDIKMPKLYITFSKKFWLNAKELDDNKNVTEPVHKIEKDMEELDKEWNFNYKQDYEKVVDVINEIEEELKKIKKIWLYETPKFKKLRDEIARKIRNLAIDLVNTYRKCYNAKEFLEESKNIVSSTSLLKQIESDIKAVKELWWDSMYPSFHGGEDDNKKFSSRPLSNNENGSDKSDISNIVVIIGIITLVLIIIVLGASKTSSYESNSSSNTITLTQNTNSNEEKNQGSSIVQEVDHRYDDTCKWSNGWYYTRPPHWYCDGWKTPLWWKCESWYTAKSENNETRNNGSWYCAKNSGSFSCSQDYNYEISSKYLWMQTEQRKLDNMYVNVYSQVSVNNYNAQVNKVNRLVEKYNRYLSEHCN